MTVATKQELGGVVPADGHSVAGHSLAGQALAGHAAEISLCSLAVGEGRYGIDTGRIREVLGMRELRRVPLAPGFIAGVFSYRGEVLTTVSFRALLGLEANVGRGCVLVLEQELEEERFGLMVDSVGGVLTVASANLEPNPGTLDARCQALFDGAYRIHGGLIVHLDPDRLRPGRLARNELFRDRNEGELRCER